MKSGWAARAGAQHARGCERPPTPLAKPSAPAWPNRIAGYRESKDGQQKRTMGRQVRAARLTSRPIKRELQACGRGLS